MKLCGIVAATRSMENPKRIFFECHTSIILERERWLQLWPHRKLILHTIQHYSIRIQIQPAQKSTEQQFHYTLSNETDAVAYFVFHFRLQLFDFVSKTHVANEILLGRRVENKYTLNLLISEVSLFTHRDNKFSPTTTML